MEEKHSVADKGDNRVSERYAASLYAVAIVNSMELSLESMLRPFHVCVVTSTINAATGTSPTLIYLSGPSITRS